MQKTRIGFSKYAVILLLATLLLFIAFLLYLPLPEIADRLRNAEVVQALLSRKKMVAAVIGLGAVAVAIWLVMRRHLVLLATGIVVAVFAVAAYGVFEFQQRYPHADFFSLDRYRSNMDILLGRDTVLSKYDPTSSLVLEHKKVDRASFPAIDVHFHLESLPESITAERLVEAMDAAGIDKVTNLGGVQGMFESLAEKFYKKYPDRFILFVKPDPNALLRKNGIEEEVEWMKKAALMGARGIKENKSFGMGQLDDKGNIIPVDDARLDPYWKLAATLGIPVLIHTGEPPAFWLPVDKHNERYAELLENPSWSLHGKNVPAREELMAQRERLLARHPQTNFIGAHFGMNAEDLRYVAYLLEKYPNYYVDMSSVAQELGREPYSARRFFIKYQDRILFGTDGGYGLVPKGDGWTPERMFRSYIEFLETDNEYINYPLQDVTKQGNWRIYGLNLPQEVLEKIYVINARKLIPTEDEIRSRL